MVLRYRGQRHRSEHGASAVEFALVLPVLTMLVFGIISFGIIFAQQLSMGNAARQGARFGAVENRTCADIISETRSDLANTIALNPAGVTITVTRGATSATATNYCGATPSTSTTEPCRGGGNYDNVYVRARYVSTMIVPFVQPSFTLDSTGVFRCEFQ